MGTRTITAISAIYRNGTLTLLDPLDIPEGATVQVEVRLGPVERADPTNSIPKTSPASRLSALVGVVSLGGDALDESEALYDADWD